MKGEMKGASMSVSPALPRTREVQAGRSGQFQTVENAARKALNMKRILRDDKKNMCQKSHFAYNVAHMHGRDGGVATDFVQCGWV